MKNALVRRSDLTDECEALFNKAEIESRGMTPGEQRTFDANIVEVREINAALAEYKRQRIADLAAKGLPAELCYLPF